MTHALPRRSLESQTLFLVPKLLGAGSPDKTSYSSGWRKESRVIPMREWTPGHYHHYHSSVNIGWSMLMLNCSVQYWYGIVGIY